MNALTFLLIVGAAAFCFFLGWVTRGQQDKPVYIPESMPHDGETHPHHLHDHDKKK